MKDLIYLAWRRTAYHWPQSIVLSTTIAVIVALPVCLHVLIRESARELRERATSAPLLIGSKGSPLELVLNSLYFESDSPPPMAFSEVQRIDDSQLAIAIPLYSRFETRHSRIVGTTLDYFEFRNLQTAEGRFFGMLGECVLGSEAARVSRANVGDTVVSSPGSVFDIAGVYPLKMRVVGVLRATGNADDRVVFVDLKTAWVIEGLAHGHQDLLSVDSDDNVLRREQGNVVANAAVEQYAEITAENVESFHFHGDAEGFPVTSAIVVPRDEKSAAILQGRYLKRDSAAQMVRPEAIVGELQTSIQSIKRYVLLALALLSAATLSTMFLVLLLTVQMRKSEFETMAKIGASPTWIRILVASELIGVVAFGLLGATVLCTVAIQYVDETTRWLVQFA